MNNIKFDDGFREYEINGDKNRILRFNPTDFSIVEKFKNYEKDIKNMANRFKNSTEDSIIEDTRDEITKIVDNIFYEGATKIIFGDVHPLSVVKGKKGDTLVLNNFFESIIKEVKTEMDKTKVNQEKKKEEYRNNVRAITSKRNHK